MGSGCQHALENALASRPPSQEAGGERAFQRSSPTGGPAYGITFQTKTFGSSSAGAPVISPFAVASSACTGSAGGGDCAVSSLAGRAQARTVRAANSEALPTQSGTRRGEDVVMMPSDRGNPCIVSPLRAFQRKGQHLVDGARAQHHHQ